MRMTYYQDTSLKVELQYKAENEWTECFETEAFKLPQTAYLGFSAHTGELTDNHDIISVNSYNLHIRQNTGASKSSDRGSRAKAQSWRGQRAGKVEMVHLQDCIIRYCCWRWVCWLHNVPGIEKRLEILKSLVYIPSIISTWFILASHRSFESGPATLT